VSKSWFVASMGEAASTGSTPGTRLVTGLNQQPSQLCIHSKCCTQRDANQQYDPQCHTYAGQSPTSHNAMMRTALCTASCALLMEQHCATSMLASVTHGGGTCACYPRDTHVGDSSKGASPGHTCMATNSRDTTHCHCQASCLHTVL
jgi:hypothetical protein